MPLRTLEQNKRFHTLIGLRKFDKEDKAALVSECTNGRTTSSSEMTISEMKLAIELLDAEQTQSIKKMRSKIINLFKEIVDLGPNDDMTQAHWDTLNVYMKRTAKATIATAGYKQLIDAVTGMERWRDGELKKWLMSELTTV
jgi:DUF438 domain-containing protein